MPCRWSRASSRAFPHASHASHASHVQVVHADGGSMQYTTNRTLHIRFAPDLRLPARSVGGQLPPFVPAEVFELSALRP